MITLSAKPPFVHSVPDVLRPFRKAGKVDSIFRPRIVGNGVFATPSGYGVSFSIGGIDSEGLDRMTLNAVSKQIAIANRSVPEECLVYEYLITQVIRHYPPDPSQTRLSAGRRKSGLRSCKRRQSSKAFG